MAFILFCKNQNNVISLTASSKVTIKNVEKSGSLEKKVCNYKKQYQNFVDLILGINKNHFYQMYS